MVVLLNKVNKYLLNAYSVLRAMISSVDITETAEVLGEQDELRRHPSKMILVPETVISILKMRGISGGSPTRHQNSFRFFQCTHALFFLLVLILFLALFHFWTKVSASWISPEIPLPVPKLPWFVYLVPDLNYIEHSWPKHKIEKTQWVPVSPSPSPNNHSSLSVLLYLALPHFPTPPLEYFKSKS